MSTISRIRYYLQVATLTVDSKTRPRFNSLGLPIHKTDEGVANFWRWFGDSVVVDTAGRPRVVYHGTSKKFTTFKLQLGVVWFTTDKHTIASGEAGAQGTSMVMPLYAKILHPAGWKQYDNLLLDQYKGHGLDGAILPSTVGHYDGFVLHPNQLKSIINKGQFSPTSNNITE